jgi:acetylornithine deacetylase/succinyl-diaminopimelate desuccinylase-like protein
VPDLRRDVIFAATADEESGGVHGMGWIVAERPDLVAADACLSEAGGVSVEAGGTRFYPIQVAEKGLQWFHITVRGTAGHASMPRADNAAVMAARIVERLAVPGERRVTDVMRVAVGAIAGALEPDAAALARRLLDGDAAHLDGMLERLCADPSHRRALAALLRDTISPNVIHAGIKSNVIPGVAEIDVDCRTLPGTSVEALEAEIRRRIGPDLIERCELELRWSGAPVEQPLDHAILPLLAETLRRHDPDAVQVPIMAPFATDAKHTATLGIPTYGFSPLRLAAAEPFLDLFHGDDERVPLAALRFGLPVLYEVVRRYCG